jgi:hypothetical protein
MVEINVEHGKATKVLKIYCLDHINTQGKTVSLSLI